MRMTESRKQVASVIRITATSNRDYSAAEM
jgi:hypothetical protein